MSRTLATLCILLTTCLFSCSKKGQQPDGPTPPVDTTPHATGGSIDPPQFILLETMTRVLNITITPSNAVNKEVTWSTSDNAIATVDPYGKVTAIKTGVVTITATSKENASVKVTSQLIVLKNYDVYTVGRGDAGGYNDEAVLWKNGTANLLPGGYGVGAEANAITLDGDDVYIAGSTLNEYQWRIATYWKNGYTHVLGDVAVDYNTFTQAIAVDAGKVYIAGFSFNSDCPTYCNGRSHAAYWKDDGGVVTKTELTNSISSDRANGIVVSNGDVIVAGGQANDNFYQWAVSWKNDTNHATILSPVDGAYVAAAVTKHGNDFWYVGYGGCPNYGCIATAFFWKNDGSHKTPLTDGTTGAAATCMAFSGDTLYIGGYTVNTTGRKVATYWRVVGNQISAPRRVSDGTVNCTAEGIAVIGNDIFLVGTAVPDYGSSSSMSWRGYEGGTTPLSVEASGFYVPNGSIAWGVYVR